MLELVMFDADGVLFDSDESNIAYYNAIFEGIGEPPLDPDERAACVYHAADQVFKMRARGDEARVARMHELGKSLDFKRFFDLLRPPFALRPFMLDLKRRYRLGLATNRSATVPAVLHHLGIADLFDAVASARDKVAPKPAPDILRLCIERANSNAASTVYVGDAEIDRIAADAAGVRFIGIGHRVEHHHRVPVLGELPRLLDQLANGAN
jgi:phosphoglycolate phosphatase-like HAD superfamily hydrolase